MNLKERTESAVLRCLRSLNARMELSESEKFYLSNLEAGFEGEVAFDKLSAKLKEERYILNDMLLEANRSDFQIDSIIISEGIIDAIDVKYFKGDYVWKDGEIYTRQNGYKCKNPFEQLKRSNYLFNQYLRENKLNFLVRSTLVFNHPEFTLYNAPEDDSIILPTQVNRFMAEMDSRPSKLHDGHKKLANILLTSNKDGSNYSKLPAYTYEGIKKGIFCEKCLCKMNTLNKYFLICGNCGGQERIENAIVRSANEFKLLFPQRILTTQSIMDWCQVNFSSRTYLRALQRHFKAVGKTKNTYYV
ncbi:NERD domain-containing protein [Neobacillus piezotolerans]|uniref:NERD domain-containing protein n=1 Tax=Neobacillus piezotolerans TaxID=2259171 RepID=A0A3D8GSM8_9BACI|nr:nuclease-related domain-containing protein [Neobacillus piezotolerans]RDU37076.1 NERD domain-containing protein [Neobacillus piezotolerans]